MFRRFQCNNWNNTVSSLSWCIFSIVYCNSYLYTGIYLSSGYFKVNNLPWLLMDVEPLYTKTNRLKWWMGNVVVACLHWTCFVLFIHTTVHCTCISCIGLFAGLYVEYLIVWTFKLITHGEYTVVIDLW